MLNSTPDGQSTKAWLETTWKQEWEYRTGHTGAHQFILDPARDVEGEHLSRRQWTLLNRLRTGVGCFKTFKKKWGLTDNATCECGEPEQTADHIISTCPLYKPPSEEALFIVGQNTKAWLDDTKLDI